MAHDQLGDRMKRHEAVTRFVLPPRTYAILRVDGRAFHSYTRGLTRPYDATLGNDMEYVAIELCSRISGAICAYTQSDEISVLFSDLQSVHSEMWFGGVIQKIASVGSAMATALLIERRGTAGFPHFDGRVYAIARPTEVANYFIWRQQDAVRNSISLAGRAFFSHKQLQGKKSGEIQEMLWAEHAVNWNEYPVRQRRGSVILPNSGEKAYQFVNKRTKVVVTGMAMRTWWEAVDPERWDVANFCERVSLP